MRISYNWLKEFVDFDLTPQQVSDRLTMAGLEVEGLEYLGEGISGVVVAQIKTMKPHPDADKLTLCEVDRGDGVVQIVCGAKNMKEGDKVPLATVGAKLPNGMEIGKAKLRGIESFGMLCSDKELGLAKESAGLLILPEDFKVGEDFVKAAMLDDWAMEINVTPNRPDCLSILGIAREVSAILRKPLTPPALSMEESEKQTKDLIKLEVHDSKLCPRYAGRVITGVKIGPSPLWMKRRLEACGVRSINNVVDVTNYVLLEMGHPLHAFDYDLLEGRRIVVRTAEEGESFTTLDGVERKLSAGMLLICDGARAVALAGIMGGQNSEVTDKTTDIFIESAYFNPTSIRKTSKALGMHTEASHRFERGTDPEGLIMAMYRASELIQKLAGGQVAGGRVDSYPERIVLADVPVRTARVNEVLGTDLETGEMTDIMGRMHVAVKDASDEGFTVVPPTFRQDLEREADVIEEVARIHGYGKIRTTLPRYTMAPRPVDRSRDASRLLKDALFAEGYSEVINYSFINPEDFDRLNLPDDDPLRNVVTLKNPLTAEQSVMRTTLLPSLINNLVWNFNRGVRDIKVFELSKVFRPSGPGLPDEPLRISAVATGRRTGSLWDGREGFVDFFDLKGVAETLLEILKVEGAVFRPATDVPFLHPGKSAWIMVEGGQAGFVGQLHPDVAGNFDIPVDAFVFEIDLQSLIEMDLPETNYAQLPRFPQVERDVALIVPDDVTSFVITKAIETMKVDLVEDVKLFDYYSGKPIPEGSKSLAYTITYRSPDRTLTDEEVNAVHTQIVESLKEKLGAETRE
ncbi:MAG TPA: phenylalanine--tRNA ligase subunit beta [Nitrospirota bacterium]